MKEFNRRRAQWQKILDNRNPRPKKKAGRPPIWRSIDGLGFVSAVQSIQLLEKCKLSTAIQKVLKDPEFAAFKKYDPRELQARYQEAWDFWGAPARAGLSPIGFARHKDDIALTALKDARAATLNALERHKKALERHKAALTDPTFRNAPSDFP